MLRSSPFRCFKTSLEIICLAVMLYIWFPLSLRNVEDLLHDRGIEISHESVRPCHVTAFDPPCGGRRRYHLASFQKLCTTSTL
jgi:transposase-like protein